MARDTATHERLLDLSHDLGKYLRLPLAMLPPDAPPEVVARAVERALLRTRKSGDQTIGARALWQRFEAELGGQLQAYPQWQALCDAVERALCWQARLDRSAPLDRRLVERDLRAVGEAIDTLIAHLEGQDGA